MNKLLTKLANSKKLQTTLMVTGSAIISVGSLLLMYGSYYLGVKNGVDARDEYYFAKEKEAYEKKYRD